MLNALLEAEADPRCGTKLYKGSPVRVGTAAGHDVLQIRIQAGKV